MSDQLRICTTSNNLRVNAKHWNLVIKNFERIEINCLSHDRRLIFRLYKTIAKLEETVDDDSSLARTFVSTGGRLASSMSMARINATATGYEILGKKSARNSKERIPIDEKEIRGATNKNTFISHASKHRTERMKVFAMRGE